MTYYIRNRSRLRYEGKDHGIYEYITHRDIPSIECARDIIFRRLMDDRYPLHIILAVRIVDTKNDREVDGYSGGYLSSSKIVLEEKARLAVHGTIRN